VKTGYTGYGNGREPENLPEGIIVYLHSPYMNITLHTRLCKKKYD